MNVATPTNTVCLCNASCNVNMIRNLRCKHVFYVRHFSLSHFLNTKDYPKFEFTREKWSLTKIYWFFVFHKSHKIVFRRRKKHFAPFQCKKKSARKYIWHISSQIFFAFVVEIFFSLVPWTKSLDLNTPLLYK